MKGGKFRDDPRRAEAKRECITKRRRKAIRITEANQGGSKMM